MAKRQLRSDWVPKRNCETCGIDIRHKIRDKNRSLRTCKFCSQKCHSIGQKKIRGKEHPLYNKLKTRYLHPDGRARGDKSIWVRDTDGKFVAEHRLVAAKALGRPLLKNEVVHHINMDSTDNRHENLLICSPEYHNWLHYQYQLAFAKTLGV